MNNFCENCPMLKKVDQNNIVGTEEVMNGLSMTMPRVNFSGFVLVDSLGNRSELIPTVVTKSHTISGMQVSKGWNEVQKNIGECEGPSPLARLLGRFGVGRCDAIQDLDTLVGELNGR
jgi:hypothetical protein